jgi:hypothetical protein
MAKEGPATDHGAQIPWGRLFGVMRGSAEVAQAMLPVVAGLTRDEVARLLSRTAGTDPREELFKVLGVVPRERYERLLRRYTTLRGRVEEAEANIEELRSILQQRGREAEARQLLDSWGDLLRRTLGAQADLVRSIARDGLEEAEPEPPVEPAATPVRRSRGGSTGRRPRRPAARKQAGDSSGPG